MGWSTDVHIHNRKSFLSVGTAALGLFFYSLPQNTNHSRASVFEGADKHSRNYTQQEDTQHSRSYTYITRIVKVKKEKKEQQWNMGRKRGRERRSVAGKKEPILLVALCQVFYTLKFCFQLYTQHSKISHFAYRLVCLKDFSSSEVNSIRRRTLSCSSLYPLCLKQNRTY